MPRERSDTKTEIRAVALELFGRKGYEKTSLREIAERLDITKAALYYHYRSKDELLQAMVRPLLDDAEELLGAYSGGGVDPRALLGDHFDLCVRHSTLLLALLNDLGSLGESGLVDRIVEWRRGLDVALVGEEPETPARMGAVVALGGIQDIAVLVAPGDAERHREAAVEIALAALDAGLSYMD
ncbi:helix-turn-helix domain-containing protein [Nocardiopsis sp. NPDC006832]|uniref:TetR/AcrR family transcriptional regulator n=1 Tax=Nocardiopsis sp. NPDC006832 TaxID=3157188 RepID=UPI00341160E5